MSRSKRPRLVSQIKREFRADGESKIYDLKLSDLVMMRTIGQFNNLLETLPQNKDQNFGEAWDEANAMISEALEESTTPELFPKMLEDTIEAQFGEKHTVLRELSQNAIDSYEPQDANRDVVINFEENKKHNVWELTVRDYGVGMTLQEVLKDLLVPYSSPKEFDGTKIGEHGIGWYSIVDIADMVKVVTQATESPHAVQTLVHHDGEKWKTIVQPISKNGFRDHKITRGTEVTGYIPKRSTTLEDVNSHLTHYLGFIPQEEANITFNGTVINTLAENYQHSTPASVEAKGVTQDLTMGVSKRFLEDEARSEQKIRDQNLDKIVITQKGLFVQHMSNPFAEGSLHEAILSKMQMLGIDFWVDLPNNVTLTKGRNSIVDRTEILSAMYESLESAFIDVILSDDSLVNHPSGYVVDAIGEIFDTKFSEKIKIKDVENDGIVYNLVYAAAAGVSGTINLTRSTFNGLNDLRKAGHQKLVNNWDETKEGWRESRAYWKQKGTNTRTMITNAPGNIAGAGTYIINSTPKAIRRTWNLASTLTTVTLQAFKQMFKSPEPIHGPPKPVIVEQEVEVQPQKPLPVAKKKENFNFGNFVVATGATMGIGGGILGISYLGVHGAAIAAPYALPAALFIGAGTIASVAAIKTKRFIQYDLGDTVSSIMNGGRALGTFLFDGLKKDASNTWDDVKLIPKLPGQTLDAGKRLKNYLCTTELNFPNISMPDLELRSRLETLAYGIRDTLSYDIGTPVASLSRRLLGKFGLFVNVDKKRAKKIEKQNEKISRRYLSKLHKDEFLMRVMDKRVVTADRYSADGPSWYNSIFTDGKSKLLETRKISISEMVELYLKRELFFASESHLQDFEKYDEVPSYARGKFVVDLSNPLVKIVNEKITQLAKGVQVRKDPKILEDHLETIYGGIRSIGTLIHETVALAYTVSPLGIVNTYAREVSNRVPYPFAETNSAKAGRFFYVSLPVGIVKGTAGIAAGTALLGVGAVAGTYGLVKGGLVGGYNLSGKAANSTRKKIKECIDATPGVVENARNSIKESWNKSKTKAITQKNIASNYLKTRRVKAKNFLIKDYNDTIEDFKSAPGRSIVLYNRARARTHEIAGEGAYYMMECFKGLETITENAAMSCARVIDPRKYPAYGTAVGKRMWSIGGFIAKGIAALISETASDISTTVKDLKEFHKEERTKKKQSKNYVKSEKKISENKGLVKVIAKVLGGGFALQDKFEWFMGDILGIGAYKGLSPNSYVHNLSMKKVNHFVDKAGIAGGHLAYMQILIAVDKLVCDSIKHRYYADDKHEPLKWAYSGEQLAFSRELNGLILEKKNKVMINLSGSEDVFGMLRRREQKTRYVLSAGRYEHLDPDVIESNRVVFDYKILDMLIHQRTHILQETIHKQDSVVLSGIKLVTDHKDGFYSIKRNLQKDVTSYMLNNNINLGELIDQAVPAKYKNVENSLYIIDNEEFGMLSNTKKRGLEYAGVHIVRRRNRIEEERQQELAEKKHPKKNNGHFRLFG